MSILKTCAQIVCSWSFYSAAHTIAFGISWMYAREDMEICLWSVCVGFCVCVCLRARVCTSLCVCLCVDLSVLHVSVLAQCSNVLLRQASPTVGGEYRAGSTLWEPEETLCLAPAHAHARTHAHTREHTHTNRHTTQTTLEITTKQNRMYDEEAVSPLPFSSLQSR